ncbi:GGDEF and EAL domain-containing protein [Rhizobium sp. XQZ8]|uniref:sensor domain-containing phosphodiesterase n=1 Tax=Rhizobium populisoli TaxID=2859785 RepID=UPI001C66584D|nr:sensor domain-containing phosphodiesterase [Rhizobium populisoli]MBW6425848.1 GGDEF and EAL domain-containing protein [Rhizobium populisoli]
MDYEEKRLHALTSLNLLDTPPSESFDRITRMAAQIFQLPIAAVSLTDIDRQWFKSKVGVDHNAIPRTKAPCAQVADNCELVVIEDFERDERYCDSLLGVSGIRFYAGAPLTTREGYSLGALCVLGTEPRKITQAESTALQDLASMVMSQIELQHAFGRIDPVSGLPNRIQFTEDLADLGKDAPDEERVIVALDLAQPHEMERLSAVMGPAACEQIIQNAARSVQTILGRVTKVYHVSSAQFVFLVPSEFDAVSYRSSLLNLLESEIVGPELKYAVTPICAMTAFSPLSTSPGDCLRSVASAVQETRATEKSVGYFSDSHDLDFRRKFRLLNDFAAALRDTSQLRIVLQPRVDLVSGEIASAEVLLRWRHPELGEISPGEFIPVVENSALAWPMTCWVLQQACAKLGKWQSQGIEIKLSVNFAASNLKEDVLGQVLSATADGQVPCSSLEIELTETSLMHNSVEVLAKLDQLVEHGIGLAIDDFGTGYSSLSYLQRLPVNVVKIDRSFIQKLGDGAREQKLVHSMIKLSHDMGHRVVAEGIEVPEAADLLRAMGCNEGQGYHFARPLELAAFNGFIDKRRTDLNLRAIA